MMMYIHVTLTQYTPSTPLSPGEILRLREDELLRKHLARMFSLVKNESVGIEDD